MARPRTRAKSEKFMVELYSMQGHRLKSSVPWGEVRQMLELGTAEIRKVRDNSGRVTGERVYMTLLNRVDKESPRAISFRECMANAGAIGSEAFQRVARAKVEFWDPTAMRRELLTCAST